jgi:hypothetical protein
VSFRSLANLTSVFSFPLPRIRDMTSERFDLDQISVTELRHEGNRAARKKLGNRMNPYLT